MLNWTTQYKCFCTYLHILLPIVRSVPLNKYRISSLQRSACRDIGRRWHHRVDFQNRWNCNCTMDNRPLYWWIHSDQKFIKLIEWLKICRKKLIYLTLITQIAPIISLTKAFSSFVIAKIINGSRIVTLANFTTIFRAAPESLLTTFTTPTLSITQAFNAVSCYSVTWATIAWTRKTLGT